MKIVCIAPSGVVAASLAQLDLHTEDEVTVVTDTTVDAAVSALTVTPALRGLSSTAERVLGSSAVGRNLQRLSPLDRGRRFAAAARRSARLRALAADADLIVALERDGVLTAWTAARRWTDERTAVVYGTAPAQAIIKQARATA